MHVRGQSSMLAGLGGPHWGLLPAILVFPWLAPGGRPSPYAPFLLLAALMASYDLAERRIPNALNAVAVLCGLAWGLIGQGWPGLWAGLLGGLLAGGLMVPFFFLGAVGAGDVKALAALGAFLGPWGAWQLFLYTVLAGGLLALGRILASRRALRAWGGPGAWRLEAGGLEMPYGLAIAAGALAMAARGGLS